ncbi:MAG: sensor histidine kinase [Gammaproteobacteria bacterium]
MRNTLAWRLVLTSSVWLVLTLIVIGMLLTVLFRQHIEARFDTLLSNYLQDNIAASEITPSGELLMTWTPAHPNFDLIRSGWYWQILENGEPVARSKSLWRESLDSEGPGIGAGPRIREFVGPDGERLRGLVQDITLPDSDSRFTFAVAGPLADIEQDVGAFTRTLTVTLAALALGLLVAIYLQVRIGLRPLHGLQRSLARIRSGDADRLPESFPAELQDIVLELNALLDHNASLLERARTQAGNLAHAMKNPLTVIRNEADELPGERGRILREQAATMTDYVARHLSRVRASGAPRTLSARAPVQPVAEDLRFSLDRLYKDKRLDTRLFGLDRLSFAGDARDLEEMLGNLMDNACKWARGRVEVRGETIGNRLRIRVDDDGPGISEGDEAAALMRGHRLDESVAGSGLGLHIVQDVVRLYRGSLELECSPLGGTRATLELPAAP